MHDGSDDSDTWDGGVLDNCLGGGLDTEAGKHYMYVKMSAFLRHFPDKNPGELKLLEVGSADGVFSEQFAKLGYDVVSVDFSLPQIEKAKTHCGNTCRFVNADGESLPFAAESFDIIISMCTVRYFTDPKSAISDWYNLLRPNGVLIIDVPNVFCPFFWGLNRIINKIVRVPTPKRTRRLSAGGVRRIFRESGFQEVETTNILLVYRYLSNAWFTVVRAAEKILTWIPGGKSILALIVCKGTKM